MKLQLTNWEVKGFWPGEPLWTKSVESTVQRRGVTPWMPVAVPGGVHNALLNAGLIADPDVGLNSLLCEWVEHRWWVFRTFFDTPNDGRRAFLRFDGIDDECRILLNGEEIVRHEGMYEPVLCDVTHLLREGEKNQLLVILMQPPREQGQIGWTSKTFTQKARFGYKWDFCTHLVNIGLWRGVYLFTTGSARVDNTCVTSDVQEGKGLIRVQAQMKGEVRGATVTLSYAGETLLCRRVDFACPWDPAINETLEIENPMLWWPNGMGGQPLYDVAITLDGESDSWQGKIGVRSLSFTRCEGAGKDALPYVPVVNGETVYIRGVNMTPLNLRYGDVTREDYRHMFDKMAHMNVNTVRIWGGGLIETEDFYELADAYGILVWQEFIQSSSGIDNVPAHDRDFLALLEKNSRAAILEKRNHVSLTWWSGGNELADSRFNPITTGDENIFMLYKLVQKLDPQRQFLPSSPSGPAFGLDNPEIGHHDVHGNWQYDGVRKHYEKYNRSDSMLQSEFGADGMSSISQLQRILPKEDYGVYTMKEHPVLRHHGEWWETLLYRDKPLFGDIAAQEHPMEAWVGVSQMMQAEAIRYIVASNRRRRGQNCGSIIWQVNEPFPNVSCTNLVEYYGNPKMAYYAVRRAYANAMAGMKYDSLIQPAGQKVQMTAYADVLTPCDRMTMAVRAYDIGGQLLYDTEKTFVTKGSRVEMDVRFTLEKLAVPVYMVRLDVAFGSGETVTEEYVFSQQEETPFAVLLEAKQPDVRVTRKGNAITLSNVGSAPAWHLFGLAKDAPHALLSDNALVLLPGETRTVLVSGEDVPAAWTFNDLAGHAFSTEAME